MAFITTGEGNLLDVMATEEWLINQHFNGRMFAAGNNQYGFGSSTGYTSTITQIGAGVNWARLGKSKNAINAISNSGIRYGWGGASGAGLSSTAYSPTVGLGSYDDWVEVDTSTNIGVGIRRNGSLWWWGTMTGSSTPSQIGSTRQWKSCAVFYNNMIGAVTTDNKVYLWGNSWSGTSYYGSVLTEIELKQLNDNIGKPIKKIFGTAYKSMIMNLLTQDGELYSFRAPAVSSIPDAIWNPGLSQTPLPAGHPKSLNDPTAEMWMYHAGTYFDSWDVFTDLPPSTYDMRFRSVETSGYVFNTYTDWGAVGIDLDGKLWVCGTSPSIKGGYACDTLTWAQIGTDRDWKQVSVGRDHAMAIKDDGSLWTWGSNAYGQLGLGDTTTRNTIVRVGTANYWKEVNAGSWNTIALTYY